MDILKFKRDQYGVNNNNINYKFSFECFVFLLTIMSVCPSVFKAVVPPLSLPSTSPHAYRVENFIPMQNVKNLSKKPSFESTI